VSAGREAMSDTKLKARGKASGAAVSGPIPYRRPMPMDRAATVIMEDAVDRGVGPSGIRR
jgi:hypothetical protein